MKLVFPGLDGTLLDHETYSRAPAQPAWARLNRHNPLDDTHEQDPGAEVEVLRTELGNDHPFTVENGRAAFVPKGYFRFALAQAVALDSYDVLEWGRPYQHVVSGKRLGSVGAVCADS